MIIIANYCSDTNLCCWLQKFRIICRPEQRDCVKLAAPVAEEHDWVGKLLLIFQCTAFDSGDAGDMGLWEAHSFALIEWFDWDHHDDVLRCDAYRLLPGTEIVSLASITRKVVMMPSATPDMFYRNLYSDMFLHESR